MNGLILAYLDTPTFAPYGQTHKLCLAEGSTVMGWQDLSFFVLPKLRIKLPALLCGLSFLLVLIAGGERSSSLPAACRGLWELFGYCAGPVP